MAEEKKAASVPHNIIIESRRRLTISGVTDVGRFDEQAVVLYCATGELAIHGMGLHINRIDVETGDVSLEGERIDALVYSDNPPARMGFFGKLLR